MSVTATATEPPRGAILFILITVLLDMLLFGSIIPVLPKLVEEFVSGDTAKAAGVVAPRQADGVQLATSESRRIACALATAS
jgi:hypothetical protein